MENDGSVQVSHLTAAMREETFVLLWLMTTVTVVIPTGKINLIVVA